MVAVVWWHPSALAVLVIVGAALTARELAHLLLRGPRQHLQALAPALAALVVALAAVPEGERVWLGTLTAALLAAGLIAQLATRDPHRFANWALAAAAGGYAGALLGLAVVLRAMPDGFAWTLLALVVTWAYDSLAYVAGRTVGRRGFMTHISPRKTWEGVAGGTAGSIAATAAFLPFLPIEGWLVVPLGLAWAAAAQTGDLVASMVKRDVGAKDSGQLIPGHGGMLDRVDGLLFVVPAVFAAAHFIG